MVANNIQSIHADNDSRLPEYIKKLEKGSTVLSHPYLDNQKAYIDKQLLIDSGARLCGKELVYPLRTLTSNNPVMVQAISSSFDVIVVNKLRVDKYKRFFHGTAGTTPVFQIFGEQDFNRANKIILCESFTKAAAIYQAIKPEGIFTVLNCGNTGSIVKVANQLAGSFRNKLIVAADNDRHKGNSNSFGYDKQVYAVANNNDLPICKPKDGYKDWDDWLALGHQAPEEMWDCIKAAKAPEQVDGSDDFDVPVYINKILVSGDDLLKLKALNKTYSQVKISGKHKVFSKIYCPINGSKLCMALLPEFNNDFLSTKPINNINVGKAWLSWEGKNYFADGQGYYPDIEKCPANVYNLFNGWGVNPIDGDVSVIIKFIEDILCGGEKLAHEYLISWLAHMVQKPMQRPTVAILLKGEQGTGKGTLDKLIHRMLGGNAIAVNGAQQLTGRFQSAMANKLFVFGDEIDLTTKYHADKMKGVISEPTMSLELKGLEPDTVKLYSRFMFAGNHSQLLQAGTKERRYLVVTPSESKIQDSEYWVMLNKIINSNGAESFLYYLLNLDISSFNPYKAAKTKGLLDEKLSSLSPTLDFLYEHITSDKPFDGMTRITAIQLRRDYIVWHRENVGAISKAAATSTCGKMMSKMGLKSLGRSDYKSGVYYDIPSFYMLKKSFASILNESPEDMF